MSDEQQNLNASEFDMPFNDSEKSKKAGEADRTQQIIIDKVNNEIDYGINEVNDRNKTLTTLLTSFLEDYQESQNTIKARSEKFYQLAIGILIGIIVTNILLVFVATFAPIDNESCVITMYVYSAVTSASSILTIPIIIAKHLFPTDRDARIVEILKSVITNDCQIREIIFKDNHGIKDND